MRRLWLMLMLAACEPAPVVATPVATVEALSAAPPARVAPRPPPPARCPRVPMALVIEADDRVVEMVSLDGEGWVHGPSGLAAGKLGELDSRGCVAGPEGVVAELAGDSLWLQRSSLPADGDRVGRFTLGPEGRVSDDDGAARMRLRGYRPEGRCAGKLLVGTFLAMMGGASMAVADGVAEVQGPPKGSVCPDRHSP